VLVQFQLPQMKTHFPFVALGIIALLAALRAGLYVWGGGYCKKEPPLPRIPP
jgi:hypothetical protein